jgi:hypothetical protein
MATRSIWHLILPLVVAVIGILLRRQRQADHRTPRGRAGGEVHPVFSAEIHRGNEAEFVNQRLPRTLPPWLFALVVAMVLIACLWSN